MIKGVHAMFYSNEAEAFRAFAKDKLKIPYTDVGRGWLIFDFPEGDMGCHPTDFEGSPPSGTHNVSFYCDDIVKSVTELKKRGVEFTDDITDQGFGLTTHFSAPGGVIIQLYEPRYTKNSSAKAVSAKSKNAAPKKIKAKSKVKRPAKKASKVKRK
jgi:predicted enzyme related to lactoylglutathione lyase